MIVIFPLSFSGRGIFFALHNLGVKEIIYDNRRRVKRSLHAVIISDIGQIIFHAVILY